MPKNKRVLIKKNQNSGMSGKLRSHVWICVPQAILGDSVAGRDSVHVGLWQGKQGVFLIWKETGLES